jgi:hypothetical protein
VASGIPLMSEPSKQPAVTLAPGASPGVTSNGTLEAALEQIRDALRGLRFGNVSIVVQDGVVVQIERTEKKRLR